MKQDINTDKEYRKKLQIDMDAQLPTGLNFLGFDKSKKKRRK